MLHTRTADLERTGHGLAGRALSVWACMSCQLQLYAGAQRPHSVQPWLRCSYSLGNTALARRNRESKKLGNLARYGWPTNTSRWLLHGAHVGATGHIPPTAPSFTQLLGILMSGEDRRCQGSAGEKHIKRTPAAHWTAMGKNVVYSYPARPALAQPQQATACATHERLLV